MASSCLSNDERNFQCVAVASVDLIKLPLRDILASHIKPTDLFQKNQIMLNSESSSRTTKDLPCSTTWLQLIWCFIAVHTDTKFMFFTKSNTRVGKRAKVHWHTNQWWYWASEIIQKHLLRSCRVCKDFWMFV